MSFLVERRLRTVGRRLRALREQLRIANEQLEHFSELADDSRLRSLVSETPLAEEEHRAAERTSSAMSRHRVELIEEIARLEKEQDELLDKLSRSRR